jgi:phosphatidylglycerophosphatase A
LRFFARFIATGAYSGYAPWVPGTMGTLVAVPLAPAFAMLAAASPLLYTAALIAAVALAVWAAGAMCIAEAAADPQIVVADEVVGYLVTLAFLPATGPIMFLAFVTFRFLDIVKPPPCGRLERLPGGLGVVADDVWAGILGNCILRVLVVAGVI